jgi:hypothetical protein
MAEFQWWLLLVGLVAGGGLVAVVSMDARRREEDLAELERQAEATWIADQLGRQERDAPDAYTVETVLRAHREYLLLPPPDRLFVDGGVDEDAAAEARADEAEKDLEVDPDRAPDDVRNDGRGRADEHLARTAEQHAPAREQAHAGADREQRAE